MMTLPALGQEEALKREIKLILVQANQPKTMPLPVDQQEPEEDDPSSLVPS